MDEIVWISIGVISIILAIGIIAKVYLQSTEDDKLQAASAAAARMAQMCSRVCRMPVDTYLPVTVSIPSGAVITAKETQICATYGGTLSCRPCECALQEYTLDLNSTAARKLFRTHDYQCFFLHGAQMSMNCTG